MIFDQISRFWSAASLQVSNTMTNPLCVLFSVLLINKYSQEEAFTISWSTRQMPLWLLTHSNLKATNSTQWGHMYTSSCGGHRHIYCTETFIFTPHHGSVLCVSLPPVTKLTTDTQGGPIYSQYFKKKVINKINSFSMQHKKICCYLYYNTI